MFAQTAFGEMSLCMRLRKMGTHYQKNYVKEKIQPEIQVPLAYSSNFIFEEKERIFKDIYPTIKMFDKFIYEARKDLERKNKKSK